MQGLTHLLTGCFIGLMLGQEGQPLGGLMMCVCGGIGALIPDIDHPRSMIGRRAGPLGGVLRLAVRHRGISHSGVAAAMVVAAALAMPTEWRAYAEAAALGYISHLVLDAATVQGVPLLWPSVRRISILPLRTGGLIEFVFSAVLVVGLGVSIVQLVL